MTTFWKRAAHSFHRLLSLLVFVILVIYHFGFDGSIWIWIVQIPCHCILSAFILKALLFFYFRITLN